MSARAVVTGASAGIGAALARGLAARGHALLLIARRGERLETLAAELRDTHGADAEVLPCDLAQRVQRARLCEQLRAREVAVLCNNAGFATCGPLRDSDPRREADEVAVNVVAMHELTLAVLPGMLDRGSGAILITGSNAGEQPVPTAATYAATKAFTNAFAEALNVELHDTGVTCTLLEPGPVRTEFSHIGGIAEAEARTWFAWLTAERVAEAGLIGMEQGRRVVIPGGVATAQALAGRYLPRRLLFLLLRRVVLPQLRLGRRTVSTEG